MLSVHTKKWLFGLGAGLFIFVVWASRAQTSLQSVSDRALPVVVTAPAIQQRTSRTVRFHAVSRPQDRAHLAFTLDGRLMKRRVVVGQSVTKGELLAVIDDNPYRHAVQALTAAHQQARVQAAQAARDARRSAALQSRGAAGREEEEKTAAAAATRTAQAMQLQAELAEAKRKLKETQLRAPFDGVVTEVQLQVGEIAAAGRPVVVIAGHRAEAELRLPETWRTHLKVGETVLVSQSLSGGVDKKHTATVRSVGHLADGSGPMFPVLLSLPDDTPPGVSLDVWLTPSRPAVMSVPSSAISSPVGGDTFVFVVKDDTVHRVPVAVRRLVADRAELVSAPFAAGTPVVVAGHSRLLNQDKVRARPVRGGRTP